MQLPAKLQEAIEDLTGCIPPQNLQAAAAALTQRYKNGAPTAIRSEHERLAYLLVRMPATFAAAVQALLSAKRQFSSALRDATVLDLGSGPGTAAWAILQAFPDVQALRLIERDQSLIDLGRRLCAASDAPVLSQAEWIPSDLSGTIGLDDTAFDVVIASYAVGELPPAARSRVLRLAWERTRKLLLVVEPGTRTGFGCVHQARAELLAMGANLLAPCPHGLTCPMAAAGDWCHFAARVERSARHRHTKGGTLGHEDEKFSYVAATPLPARAAEHRVVRHPAYHTGFVELQLCSAQGLQKILVGKSQKALYRAARHAAWGDAWPAHAAGDKPLQAR